LAHYTPNHLPSLPSASPPSASPPSAFGEKGGYHTRRKGGLLHPPSARCGAGARKGFRLK